MPNIYDRVESQIIGESTSQLTQRQFNKLQSHRSAFIARGKGGLIVVIDEGSGFKKPTPFTPTEATRRNGPWQPFSYEVRQERGRMVGTHN